jgi:hypothetical protein
VRGRARPAADGSESRRSTSPSQTQPASLRFGDLESGVWDSGSRVSDFRSGIWDPVFGIQGLGSQTFAVVFGIRCLGFRVGGSGLMDLR